jgi:hypothetical protein
MKERMVKYMDYIDRVLKNNDTGFSYEQLLDEHKVQLSFFIHERLVHLLVTLTFALLAFGTFFITMMEFSLGLVLLLVLFLVLLVPYILHYYLLENGVQKMYRQYDELYILANGKDRQGK